MSRNKISLPPELNSSSNRQRKLAEQHRDPMVPAQEQHAAPAAHLAFGRRTFLELDLGAELLRRGRILVARGQHRQPVARLQPHVVGGIE